MNHIGRVRDYYNANTRRFLRWGRRQSTGAIHREIWAPGVSTRKEAQLYLNRKIADNLRKYSVSDNRKERLLDLGCGVGGTTIWLVNALGMEGVGISLSEVQIRLAQQAADTTEMPQQCTFHIGDLLDLSQLDTFQAAIAIESFAHTDRPDRFFRELVPHLSDGGLFILCDDTLISADRRPSQSASEKWIRRFRQGWKLQSLLPVGEIRDIAESHGFQLVKNRDLTPYLRIKSALGFLLAAPLYLLPVSSPYLDNLRGGNAGQKCLQEGWTEYRYLVFRK